MKQARTVAVDLDRLSGVMGAMGAPQRLRIVRLLLAAGPEGMPAGEIQAELAVPASTLSHHLDRLRQAGVVHVRREGTYLWYSANNEALEDLLSFLYAECCSRVRLKGRALVVQCSGTKQKR